MKRRSAIKEGRARRSPYARHGKRPYRYPSGLDGAPLPIPALVAWRRRNGERGAP